MIDRRAKNDIVVGRPRTWPYACCRWLPPNRVKSGMFSERVAQNAIIAISDGANSFQKSAPQPSFDGWDRIGPSPPASTITQISRATATTMTNGAAQFSKRRSVSMPRQMIAISITQNRKNEAHSVQGWSMTVAASTHQEPSSFPAMA